LSKWVLGGRLPNNGFGVVLSEKEVLTIGFTVSGVSSSGHVAYGSVCSGASILPPVDAWKDDAWSTSIKSTDGSCELTVNLSGQKSTKAGSGGVVMPQADIAIRNVSLIGNQIFALVENDGPDPLVNNTVFVGGVFGYQCQDGSDTKWGWWNGPITHVQSNLPQLIHLSYYLDNEFMQWHTGVADFEEREGCEFGIFVIAQAPENEAKGEKPNYLDSNKTNNALFVPFDRILPVQ